MRAPHIWMAFSSFVLSASASSAFAQDTIAIPIQKLEVTVTRIAQPLARVPAAVSVVSKEDIQRAQPGTGLEEALASVPGLIVNNRYNYALGTRISMRGYGARAAFGVRGIRVLQDGVPLTMPDGQANLNNIDLTSTGRIEVMRGASSMLYGNAAGGVVAFETETPASGFAAEARVIAGDGELRRGNIKFGGGSNRTRALVNVARLEANGFRAHSRIEQTNVNARLRHTFDSRTYLALTLNAADAPTALNPGSLPRDSALRKPEMAWPRNAATRSGEAVQQVQGGVEFGRDFGALAFNSIFYALTRSLENPLPFAYITLDRNAFGLRSSIHRTFSGLHLTGGVDVELQRDTREEFNNEGGQPGSRRMRDQTDHIANFGPFIRSSLDITSRFTATAGVRYDQTRFEITDRFFADNRDNSGERAMSAVSPSLGMTLRLSDAVNAYASVSTAFQTPTTTELINNPAGAGINDLEPQRSISFEVGTRAATSRLAAELTLYRTNVRDALVPFQLAGGDGREFFRNAARTRQQGVEASITAVITRAVRLTTSYTLNDFVFIDDGLDAAAYEGNELPGVPPHHFFARLTWAPSWWFAEIEGDFTSAYYASDSNADASKNPAATVIDARFGLTRQLGRTGLAPFIGINNVLDEKYFSSVVINAAGGRYFEPAPGRNIYFGIGVGTGNWH
jgi:iron complex outermembrane recepter protein